MVIIEAAIFLGSFAYLAINLPIIPELRMVPHFEDTTFKSFIVYKMTDEITAINRTTITYTSLVEVYYDNATGQEVKRETVLTLPTNYTSELVFGTFSASYVLNWAMNHSAEQAGVINVWNGNYTLDNTIEIPSNTAFNGGGSWFSVSKNFTGDVVFSAIGSNHISISNTNIDGTNLYANQSCVFVEVSPNYSSSFTQKDTKESKE